MRVELAMAELQLLISKRCEMISHGRDLHYHDDNRITELRRFVDSLVHEETAQEVDKESPKQEDNIPF
jgi:hypothetical protein